MKVKKESLILGKMLQKIAPQIGASVLLEPEWGIAGQITFKSGKHSYFRYNTMDLNPVGSSDIAKDKDYSAFFMRHLGYPVVPQSKSFFSKEWGESLGEEHRTHEEAYAYAEHIGFPVIVKPNSGSQGSGVALVYNKREFQQAVRAIFKKDRIMLVQQYVEGKDYRIVVLDNRIISAYERIPLNVTGDGRLTVLQLLTAKQKQFRTGSRDTKIKTDDVRITNKLAHQGLSFNSVPKKGEQIFLLDNANLSTGGDAVDVTELVHPSFKDIAIRLTKDMGLRLCGVDLLVKGDIAEKAGTYCVLEINAAPGLDHYVKSGPKQEKIVEALYLEVLKSLDK